MLQGEPVLADSSIPSQSESWSKAADRYEEEFIDPDRPGGHNPLRPVLIDLARRGKTTVADLGCGTGPLLPLAFTVASGPGKTPWTPSN
jgi:hypothetical protein